MATPAFDFDSFCVNYPTLAGQTTSSYFTSYQATNYYNNEALVIGSKILALINNNTDYNTWDASTNTPTLVNGTGTSGTVYLTTVAGTVNFGAGDISFNVNDLVSYNGSIWSDQGYPVYYYYTCLILAHILVLKITQQPGRVSSATEGTVSTNLNYSEINSAQWWNQTSFGQEAYQLVTRRGGATYYPQASYNGFPVSNYGYWGW